MESLLTVSRERGDDGGDETAAEAVELAAGLAVEMALLTLTPTLERAGGRAGGERELVEHPSIKDGEHLVGLQILDRQMCDVRAEGSVCDDESANRRSPTPRCFERKGRGEERKMYALCIKRCDQTGSGLSRTL